MSFTALLRDGYLDLGDYCAGFDGTYAATQLASDFGMRLWRTPEILSANAAHTKPPNTYGGNFGLDRLPLHTDMAHWAVPPRFLMLRCVFGDASVTTPLIHHRDFLDQVPQKSIERARFRPRRPLGGEMFLVRLLHQGIFRWDELFLVPDNSAACDVRAAVNVNTALARAQEVTLARPSHTILIDNWSVLHGRSPVPSHAMNRRIERAYFTGASDGY